MNRFIFLTLGLFLGLHLNARAALPDSAVLPNLQGQKKSLNLHAGKPVLLVFFASWCAPCKKEAPHLVAYQNSPQRRCSVMGICVDKEASKGQDFVDSLSINYPVLHDPALHFSDQMRVRGTPTLILLDGNGNVLHQGKKFDKKLIGLLGQL